MCTSCRQIAEEQTSVSSACSHEMFKKKEKFTSHCGADPTLTRRSPTHHSPTRQQLPCCPGDGKVSRQRPFDLWGKTQAFTTQTTRVEVGLGGYGRRGAGCLMSEMLRWRWRRKTGNFFDRERQSNRTRLSPSVCLSRLSWVHEYSAASSACVCVACLPFPDRHGSETVARLMCFTVYKKESELLTWSILHVSASRV